MLRRLMLAAAIVGAAVTTGAAQETEEAPAAEASAPQPQLQQFEPNNALERTFVAALDNASMRPAFRRQFLESQIAVLTASDADDAPARLIQGPNEAEAALVFTSAALLEQRFGPEAPRRMLSGRNALAALQEHHVIINFGYAPMLVLDQPGIANFLEIPPAPSARPAE